LEPGRREPVPAEGIPTAVEPPAKRPPGLITVAEVPPAELVAEGAATSSAGPVMETGEPGTEGAAPLGPGIDVAVPAARGSDTPGPLVDIVVAGPGAVAGVAAPGFGIDIPELPGIGTAAPVPALKEPVAPAVRKDGVDPLRTEVDPRSRAIGPVSLPIEAWAPGGEGPVLTLGSRPTGRAGYSPLRAPSPAGTA
jgi:hypothetical protein